MVFSVNGGFTVAVAQGWWEVADVVVAGGPSMV